MTKQQTKPLRHHSIQATRVLHEHIGIILAFAYARPQLEALVKTQNLAPTLVEMARERAERALIELGLYIRIIDDGLEISSLLGPLGFGEVVRSNGSRQPLELRDVANKILHAGSFSWIISANSEPGVTCYADKNDSANTKWSEALINLNAIAGFCGSLNR